MIGQFSTSCQANRIRLAIGLTSFVLNADNFAFTDRPAGNSEIRIDRRERYAVNTGHNAGGNENGVVPMSTIATLRAERVTAAGDLPAIVGESPVWHAGEGALYWVDIA